MNASHRGQREEMTAGELAEALEEAISSGKVARSDSLLKNGIGNLAIYRDSDYIGYIDLSTSEVFTWGGWDLQQDDDPQPSLFDRP